MTEDIGDIIISKIEPLPFIDKKASIVRTLEQIDAGKKKTFPASIRQTLEEGENGRYMDLCPDSSKKSVLFLDDRSGTRLQKKEGKRLYFTTSLTLLCWLNLPKLGVEGTTYSSAAIAAIISKFPASPFTSGIY